MAALGYLVLLLIIGDTLAGPLMGRANALRRLATAFLVGLLTTTWLTYITALLLRDSAAPLDSANLVTLAVGEVLLATRLTRGFLRGDVRRTFEEIRVALGVGPGLSRESQPPSSPGADREESGDWILTAAISFLVAWMMWQTYAWEAGELQIGSLVWSDFGPTTAIAQSFAAGDNLPTQYPHFSGLPILYHFLFNFQAGNLTYLGWDPSLALNVLSTASMVSLLVLVAALGRRLFASSAVGWIGALLFFVHGSLAWIDYARGFESADAAISAAAARTSFLPSGFPYRGEDWGVWTQVVFLNQRHLASAIGILLVVILFVLERRAAAPTGHGETATRAPATSQAEGPGPADRPTLPAGTFIGSWLDAADRLALAFRDRVARPWHHVRAGLSDPSLLGYVIAGYLLGLLPLWNSAVFLASAAVMAVLFLLLSNRAQMTALAIAAGSAAIPQLLALRPPGLLEAGAFPILHVGYVVEDASPGSMAAYLAFTFGPKLLLALFAVVPGTWRQWAVLLAFSGLVAVAFLFQFSVEVLANHKLLNVWLVVLNLFAAAGLVRLWQAGSGRWPGIAARAGTRLVAWALIVVIAVGGLIDLAPVRNVARIGIALEGDPLVAWIRQETRPDDVFLTDLLVTHPILLAGRRLYYGWPYYAWSAGYPTGERESEVRAILGSTDAAVATARLQRGGISFVAIDDGLRARDMAPYLNESLFREHFERVFGDAEGRYAHLDIYRVPAQPVDAQIRLPVDLFTGGAGTGLGRFVDPLGVAVAPDGTILVADTGNHRIQGFAPDGSLQDVFGGEGRLVGRFDRPSGVAVDSQGRRYVADLGNDRVQEFDAGGRRPVEWRGPDPGFRAPRDVYVGPGDQLYVLDAGNGRVVERAPDGTVRSFGAPGSGAGELREPTGVAADGERIYVADAGNGRVVIFPRDGSRPTAFPVPEWELPGIQHPDIVVADDGRHLFLSGLRSNAVVVVTLDGRRVGTLATVEPDRFDGPAAMALRQGGGIYVVQLLGNRVSLVPSPG